MSISDYPLPWRVGRNCTVVCEPTEGPGEYGERHYLRMIEYYGGQLVCGAQDEEIARFIVDVANGTMAQ